MIETLSADRTDQTFDVRVLPRTPGSGQDVVDLHRLETGPKGLAVDPVSVSQQESGRRVPGERVADLLRGPRGRRMFRDIDMHDPTAVVTQDEEDEQHPEGGRRHGEEVDGHEIGHVIIEKAPPPLRGGRSASYQLLDTVAWAIEMPSFSSSPCTRGAPDPSTGHAQGSRASGSNGRRDRLRSQVPTVAWRIDLTGGRIGACISSLYRLPWSARS
jgi:hypothetical protein